MRVYMMLMLAVIMALCSIWGSGAADAAPVQVEPGTPFVLMAGQTAALKDGSTVTFDKVLADSRCPATAECITAGSVQVQVSVDEQLYTLTLGDLLPGNTSSVQMPSGMTLTLLEANPYPASQDDTPDAIDTIFLQFVNL